MPSILDLFGELDLKTDKFDRSLKSSVAQMKAADSQLDRVISTSNKLGDTSATVARRYEKLNEGVAQQSRRLLEAAKAFEGGDISAKKFESTIASVDRTVAGLNSRIKDAKARVTELNETGLTHFQNQISGAVGPANPVTGSRDLFKSLSSFQKTQLSFQLNDIITGLASGQDPLRILAQQGGQVFQIFQQGKTEATGIATAVNAAAVAEGKFAASSQVAAVAQAETAVASKATAASMTEASASATVFGYSIVGVGAALAAGVISILAAKKASEHILETAQKRLKYEEAITAEFNRQNVAVASLKDRLKIEGGDRWFSSALEKGSGPGYMLQARQQQYAENAKAVQDEINRRTAINERMGATGQGALDYVKGATPVGFDKSQAKLADEISALTARISEGRQPKESGVEWYTKILEQQKEALKKSTVEAAKVQREVIEQQIKEENAALQNKFKVQESALRTYLQVTSASQAESIVATTRLQTREIDAQIASTRRHYNAIIATAKDATEAQQAESNKRIAMANLEAQKQIAAIEKVRQLASADSQKFDKTISAYNLRSEAAQFGRGYKESADMRYFNEELERYKQLFNPSSAAKAYAAYLEEQISTRPKLELQANLQQQISALSRIGRFSAGDQSAFDQKIIALTQGLEGQLTSDQNSLARGARLREADRIEKERDATTKELIKAIREGAIIHIVNDAPDSARVTRRPSAADVAERAGN